MLHPSPLSLNTQTNFDARDYTGETIPPLTGKTREEVKTTLKSERIKQARWGGGGQNWPKAAIMCARQCWRTLS